MIITVTLNPALDKTAELDELKPYALNRLQNVTVDAGGKGINVSAMVAVLGRETIALGFAGGASGDELLFRIKERGIKADFVRTKNATRTNLKVMQKDGALTEFNESGAEISPDEWNTLEKKLLSYAANGTIFVLSGSLPKGLPNDTYQKLCEKIHAQGAKVFVDADGEPFRLAMETPPDYIKPNTYELLQYFGKNENMMKNADAETELVEMCKKLLAKGVSLVALSMGRDGAIFAANGSAGVAEVWRVPEIVVPVKSTVGAGDSMVGALVYGIHAGLSVEECIKLSTAVSTGAVTTVGTKSPDFALVQELLKKVVLKRI